MNVVLWLLIVSAISLEARRGVKREKQKRDDLSDEDILEFLSDLILESEGMREGKQLDDVELDYDDIVDVELVGRRQNADQTRGYSPSSDCILVGFEFLNKTECNEVFEIECAPANVTKFRTELVDKCETVIDQTCNLRMTEVPERKCQERLKQK